MNANKLSSTKKIAMGIALTMSMALNPAFAIHAHDGSTISIVNKNDVGLSFQASAMYLEGQGDEYIYAGHGQSVPADYKVSELNWDLSELLMVGGVASLQLGELIRFNAGMWVGVTDGDGGMKDYDWLVPSTSDWSEYSESDVDIESAVSIDLNASMRFVDLGGVQLHGVLGYKTDYWEWSDYAGNYIYSSGGGFRNDRGSLGGVNGIDYEQTFEIPYAGIKATANTSKLHASAYFLYSPFVTADDKDHHIMRNLYFEEEFDGGDFYSYGAEATIDLSNMLFLSLAVDVQEIPEFTGDMKVKEGKNGHVQKSSDTAGIGNSLTAVSASVGIKF